MDDTVAGVHVSLNHLGRVDEGLAGEPVGENEDDEQDDLGLGDYTMNQGHILQDNNLHLIQCSLNFELKVIR